MNEMIKSDTTGKWYNPSECIRLLNIKQLLFYMNHNVEILDFYASKDFKTNEDILVFIVNKKDSQEAYKKWLESRSGINE